MAPATYTVTQHLTMPNDLFNARDLAILEVVGSCSLGIWQISVFGDSSLFRKLGSIRIDQGALLAHQALQEVRTWLDRECRRLQLSLKDVSSTGPVGPTSALTVHALASIIRDTGA